MADSEEACVLPLDTPLSGWGEASRLFVWAVALRAAVFGASFSNAGLPIRAYLDRSDALSYMALARMVLTGERSPNPWDERVYWGWALLQVPVEAAGLNSGFGCVSLGIFLTGVAAVLMRLAYADARLAVLFAGFTPTWVLQSSVGMSEPAYLVFLLAAFVAAGRSRPVTAGALVGMAALVRPTAVFFWAGLAVVLVRRRMWGQLVAMSAMSAAGPAVNATLNWHYYGVVNRQAELHGRPANIFPQVLAVLAPDGVSRTYAYTPFKALIETPRELPTPTWKVGFVYAHLLAVLLATTSAVWSMRSGRDVDVLSGVWAAGTTAFIVSTGPYWGFHSFDRYCVWALPAYLYAVRRWIPVGWPLWAAGLVSMGLSLWSYTRF